jgi:hypothetical protein
MKIFIPYRPSRGGLDSIGNNPMQLDDYSFQADNNNNRRHPDDDIHRCLKSIAKNSRYRHEAVVCIDEDLQICDDWLKHLNIQDRLDITIFRCKNKGITDAHNRLPESLKQAILSLATDKDIIAYDLIADAIVCKNWDVQIINCVKEFGEKYYYASMFVEPRTEQSRALVSDISRQDVIEDIKKCSPQTVNNIWNLWRKSICCHSLTMIPKLDRNYAIESDFDEYISIANQFDKEYIIENAGERTYGYWAPLISTGRIFKELLQKMVCISGSDLWLDNNFPMQKMVLCRSYVFHMHYKTILDDKKVEYVNEN